VIGALLWTSGVLLVAFLLGLGDHAMAEAQSIAPVAVGVTVVAVERTNEAVDD